MVNGKRQLSEDAAMSGDDHSHKFSGEGSECECEVDLSPTH